VRPFCSWSSIKKRFSQFVLFIHDLIYSPPSVLPLSLERPANRVGVSYFAL
jgi:hypothetical protein